MATLYVVVAVRYPHVAYRKDGSGYETHDTRTLSICTKRANAIERLNPENVSDDGYYNYAVVEPVSANSVYEYAERTEQEWFRYNSDTNTYDPIPQPAFADHTIGWWE